MINCFVYNKKWMKRKIVGLFYEENVDGGFKNVLVRGNLFFFVDRMSLVM